MSKKQQILELLADGRFSQSEIANKLGMSRQAISFHKNDKPRRPRMGRPSVMETHSLLINWLETRTRLHPDEISQFIKDNNIDISYSSIINVLHTLGYKHYHSWEREEL